MTADALRVVERTHGWVAVVATLALGWAAWSSVKRPARAAVPAIVAAALGTVSAALGLVLEAPYRSRLRPRIFAQSVELGWLFERKEHLAFGAIVLAWTAVFALAARAPAPSAAALDLERAARRALVASAALAVASAIASVVVAQYQRL